LLDSRLLCGDLSQIMTRLNGDGVVSGDWAAGAGLLQAAAEGCEDFVTFDRRLIKAAGVEDRVVREPEDGGSQ
jgi:hypothetical protein